MSVTLVEKPIQQLSKWSAVFNQVVFSYQTTFVSGHKIRTEITSGATVFTCDHSPNLAGLCRADISKYLRTLLTLKDTFDYSVVNAKDGNMSAAYTVRYAEVWPNSGDPVWTAIPDTFYITYSALQIGSATGGNMLPFVPGATTLAKFMNDFKEPVFYTDMPFDLSFIYSELIAGKQIKVTGIGVDVNGVAVGKMGDVVLLNENGSLILNEDGTRLLVDSKGADTLNEYIGVNRLCFYKNKLTIPENSNWLDIQLSYTNDAGVNVPITEAKRLLLDHSPCNGDAFEYIKWIGPSGGWLYYMFVKNQTHEMQTSNPVTVDNYIPDYSTANSSQQQISIEAQERVTIGRNGITIEDAKTLATMLYSPAVYRLIDAAANIWQGVTLDTRSLKMYQTWGRSGDFEAAVKLPAINTQSI